MTNKADMAHTAGLSGRVGAAIALAGRHGPVVLAVGLLLGFAFPPMAAAARPLRDLAIFAFTFGAFLSVDWAAMRGEFGRPGRHLAILVWAVVVVPTALAALALATGASSEPLAQAVVLAALAPPATGAAAVALMLGLHVPTALVASVAAILATPLYVPALAWLFTGTHVDLDPLAMAYRLALLVGGGFVAAVAVRRFFGPVQRTCPALVTGISVVGLAVFAVGAMAGVQAQAAAQPALMLVLVGLAYSLNLSLQVAGAALFLRAGLPTALAVGLCSGSRNVALVWSALGAGIAPTAELYFAACMFPIYTVPLLLRPVARLCLRGGAAVRVGA